MSKILERVVELTKNEKLTISAFEKKIGASNGVISKALAKGSEIQLHWLERIAEQFPQYSCKWLLTGEGEMMAATGDENRAQSQDAKEDRLLDILQEQQKLASGQQDSIRTLSETLNTQSKTIYNQSEAIGKLADLKGVATSDASSAQRDMRRN